MGKTKMNAIAWVAVSVVLILISCIGASLIQTDFGGVTVTDVRLPMPDGETLRVLVHRPATATEDNPAPAVITSHGYHATLETQDITSIELARRGFVVFNMDTYSAGSSSGTTLPYGVSRSYYGLGMLQLVDLYMIISIMWTRTVLASRAIPRADATWPLHWTPMDAMNTVWNIQDSQAMRAIIKQRFPVR